MLPNPPTDSAQRPPPETPGRLQQALTNYLNLRMPSGAALRRCSALVSSRLTCHHSFQKLGHGIAATNQNSLSPPQRRKTRSTGSQWREAASDPVTLQRVEWGCRRLESSA